MAEDKLKTDSNRKSLTPNSELMRRARDSLKGKWGLAIGVCLVNFLVAAGCNAIPFIGFVVGVLVNGPLVVGLALFSLNLSRGKDAKLEQLFDAFYDIANPLVAYLLVALFTLLWLLLLIVPGIIAALSYSMTFFIIADDKSISAQDAIKKSKQMMTGHKGKLFGLGMRFFGLGILCIFTLGIGFIWLIPYSQLTMAKFYDDLKANSKIV